jgi:AcrR family transcriptional regulator
VAERAGVAERTVYRHFPTVQYLHDAVMHQVEEEAGITYEDLELRKIADVADRVFASRQSFAVKQTVHAPDDPAFVSVYERRRNALIRAVSCAAPHWPEHERYMIAALLDVLWDILAYERLVGPWQLGGHDATQALTWLISKVVLAVSEEDHPLV